MARLPRLEIPHLAHLVTQPVLAGEHLVRDDTDLQGLRQALVQAATEEGVAVHAWRIQAHGLCLVATPGAPGQLSAFMQAIGRRHVARYNRRHAREGSLWAGRFRACALQPGPTVLEALLWVEAPAWAGRSGPSSSAWAPAQPPEPVLDASMSRHLGGGPDALHTEHESFWLLGNTPFEREAAWRQRLELGLSAAAAERLARSLRSGWPVGDAGFLAQVAAQAPLGRPVSPRPRGRPRKALVCP